jgi:hypothetical protein
VKITNFCSLKRIYYLDNSKNNGKIKHKRHLVYHTKGLIGLDEFKLTF